MGSVIAIALKDLRLLWRDRLGLFWVLAFPMIYASFFGAIFSGGGGTNRISIAVIDQDGSDASRSFVERLRASDALNVYAPTPASATSSAPARASIEPPARTVYVTVESARAAVLRGDLVAYVAIKKDFGNSQGMFLGQAPPLEVGIDPSRKAEAGMLQGVLMESAFKGMAEQFTDPAKMRAQIARGMKSLDGSTGLSAIQRGVLKTFMGSLDQFFASVDPKVMRQGAKLEGAKLEMVDVSRPGHGWENFYEISFPSAIVWGLMACSAAFAISLVKERTAGTLLRLRLAPISRTHVLAGKGIACYVACCTAILLVLAMGHFVFKVRLVRPVNLVLAVASASACFVGLMMLMCTLGKTEASVGGAGWGINCVMAMLGGGMVPLMFMPKWMQAAGSVSPVKWSILALEGAIWRDFTLGQMATPCAILVGVGLVGFAAGARIFSGADT